MRYVSAIQTALSSGDTLRDLQQVVRFTRHWIHYGFLVHTLICVLIAAAEGLMGR